LFAAALLALAAPIASQDQDDPDALPLRALTRMGTLRWRQPERVTSAAVSPDGRVVASAVRDHEIYLFDSKTGKRINIFRASNGGTVLYSCDGRTLYSLGFAGLSVLDAQSGVQILEIPSCRAPFDVTGDGTRLLVSLLGTGVCLYDIPARRRLLEMDGVESAHFLPGNAGLLTLENGRIQLRDRDGVILREFGDHPDGVVCVELDPQGRRAATLDRRSIVRVWDLTHASLEFVFPVLDDGLYKSSRFLFSNDGCSLHLFMDGDTAFTWDLSTGACTRHRKDQGPTPYCGCGAVSPDRSVVAFGVTGGM
jgi:WD40 repeat protein